MKYENTNKEGFEILEFYKAYLYNHIDNNLFHYFNDIRKIRYGKDIEPAIKESYNEFYKKHDDVIHNTHLSFYSFESMNEDQFRQYFIYSGCYDNVLDMFSDYKMLFEVPDFIVNEYYRQKGMEQV